MRLLFSKLITVTVIFIGISFNSLLAQEKLEGYLTDVATNQPVSYAHLGIRGKSRTISNEEGYFRIDPTGILNSDTLVITHINYVSIDLSIKSFREQTNKKIKLKENIIQLKEIQVKVIEDFQAFEDIVKQTKKSLSFPITTTIYYRELVRENKSFNKFADGLLTVVYEKNEDQDNIEVKVDQCRVEKLPKDDDDQFEMISPVKIESVLGHTYVNFLNKFRNEKQINYHFYAFNDSSTLGGRIMIIEPKKEADRSDNQLLFRATIKADQNNIIKEALIEMDSLSHYEKSLLGLKMEFVKTQVLLSFKEERGINYLAFARINYILRMTTKKFAQLEDFVSEFVVLDLMPGAKDIERGDIYKRNSLYKKGNKYESPFWKGSNIPIFTAEEERLLGELENKRKTTEALAK